MEERPLKDCEVLLTYARYIDQREFDEEMYFCESLESATTAKLKII